MTTASAPRGLSPCTGKWRRWAEVMAWPPRPFKELPAVAVSLYLRNEIPADYPRAAAVTLPVIQQMLAAGLRGGQVVSVNVPPVRPGERPAGVRVVRQCTRAWVDTYEERLDPRGRK